MKTLRSLAVILFLAMISFGTTSCVIRNYDDDGGRHRERVHKHRNNGNNNTDVIIIKEKKRGHH